MKTSMTCAHVSLRLARITAVRLHPWILMEMVWLTTFWWQHPCSSAEAWRRERSTSTEWQSWWVTHRGMPQTHTINCDSTLLLLHNTMQSIQQRCRYYHCKGYFVLFLLILSKRYCFNSKSFFVWWCLNRMPMFVDLKPFSDFQFMFPWNVLFLQKMRSAVNTNLQRFHIFTTLFTHYCNFWHLTYF